MKKIISLFLCTLILLMNSTAALAVQDLAALSKKKAITYNKNAKTIKYAFVFDGPSDKNAEMLEQFKKAIIATTAPEFRASFDAKQVYVGNWTVAGAKAASDKALASDAGMVVSLGYLSTKYLQNKPNKNKFVMTIDQYGLRDLGDGFFNPVQQSIVGIKNFKILFEFKKAAVLINDYYYRAFPDIKTAAAQKLQGIDYTLIPVTTDVQKAIASIPKDCDAVILTPLFNLSKAQRKQIIDAMNARKVYTYSTLGKEDVELGALVGSSAYDLDRKVAEEMSFSIKNVLAGNSSMKGQLNFFEDEIFYLNQDTADLIGYKPHIRLESRAEIISSKPVPTFDLGAILTTMHDQNLDIKRKELLVRAARRSSIAAALRYLPSLVINLGYQDYNSKFAESANLLYPDQQSAFQIGMEQILYSPALVTNIIVKKKGLNFAKEEAQLTELNVGINLALAYVETLIMDNRIKIQKEQIKQTRENLAIARVREKLGKCGKEEAMRWAAQVNIEEQQLLDMQAAHKNELVMINKILYNDQRGKFNLAPLTSKDPAFFTKDIHIIDYLTTYDAIEQFTQMITEEAYKLAPELAKLRTAQQMKKAEMAMYYQKFILPDAKLSLYHTTLFNRKYVSDMVLPAADMRQPAMVAGGHILGTPITLPRSELNNLSLQINAQWKPIEGGTKIAEIARIKAELDELKRYEDEVKTSIEEHVRTTINRAISAYLSIEKDYKAMYASGENYKDVKIKYHQGNATISQLQDAQKAYFDSKLSTINSQYVFFKELLWVQRCLCSINWSQATPEAKKFIEDVKTTLERRHDVNLL